MSRRAALGVFVILAGAAWVSPGCASSPQEGYSFKSAHSDNIRTVSVPIFNNKTYATGLEVELTEAVVKEIQRTTGWTVTSSGVADATLIGVVQGSEFKRLSTDRQTGLDEEVGQAVRVDFELRDNRSGKVITARQNFSAMDTFAPSIRAGERPEVGRSATVTTLAHDIVAELRDTW